MAAPSMGSLLTCWMLLAVFAFSCAQARYYSPFQQPIYPETSSTPQINMIRAELIHRDHPNSPLAPPEGTTFSERLAAAAQRSHDRHFSRFCRRRLEEFQTPLTLKGGFGGEYVMNIAFGTPAQSFVGLVDTGSDLVWVQCDPCIQCFPQPNPVYNPAASSSEIYVPCADQMLCNQSNFQNTACGLPDPYCRIGYAYADKSQIQGTLTKESITLTNTAGAAPSATSFLMGCMNNNSGIFDNYDGIIGFGRGVNSLPSQFSTINYLQVFAYCLVPYTATTTLTSSLLFGSRNLSNPLNLHYTPLLPIEATYYWVNMTGVSVGGVLLAIPVSSFQYSATGGGVIFDSGTPYTHFHPAIFDAIRSQVASLITYPIVSTSTTELCFDIAGVQNPQVPEIVFHYGGEDGSVVDFVLEGANTYVPLSNTTLTVYCLAFSVTDLVTDTMIIGSIAQANHHIEHDVVNMRMGWVSKDCTIPG